MNVEKCALKSLAAFALICGFALAARAQLGTGWSSAPETYVVQTSSGCTAVANSSGGGTFTVPSGINRAEFRYGNLPTTTTNQFQGDVVYNSLGGNRVNCKQTFGPDPSTPWEMLAFDKTLVAGSNPPGAFFDVEQKPLPQPGLYPYTVGASARVNTIFDPSAKTVDVYINGSHIIQDTGHSGPNYNKIGAYVTGSGTGPATVTWTNVQFWAGGKAPPQGGTNFTLTASAGANGSISPPGSVTVPQGGSQLFTITPNSGYNVASVTVDGASAGAVTSYTFTNVQANHTISATFSKPTSNPMTIVATAGANGSISPSGTVTVSTSQTFTMTPNSGFFVASVTVDGSNLGSLTSYTFPYTAGSTHTISVTFQPVVTTTFTITATAGANGSISPSGSIAVAQGNSQMFTITPSSGYTVASVTVDGSSAGAVTSYTFTNVQANHTISATFMAPVACVSATAGSGWTNTAMASQTGAFTATFDAMPSASPTNSVVALSNGAQTSYSNFPCLVRFNPSGDIDARNGGAYAAASTIPYAAGVSYHFRLVLNVSAKTYSIYVTPAGGSELTVGLNYAFRVSATPLNYWGVYVDNGSGGTGTVTVCNFNAGGGGGITYTISTSAGPNGSITPSGNTSVAQGGTSTPFMITANSGYTVADVEVDGSSIGIVTSYTFTNVQANHTLSATFQSTGGGGGSLTGIAGNGFHSLALTSAQTGTFTATFTGTPSVSPENAVVGLSSGAATSYTGLACIARFNPSGDIDAYNGTAYAAASTIPYSASGAYQFRLVVNVTAHTYSIYVTPPGGTELTVGLNYAFRSTANTMTSLNTWNLEVNATPANCSLTASNLSGTTGGGGGPFTITSSGGANGTIAPNGVVTLIAGSNQSYTITPNSGFAVAQVSVDGSSAGAVTSYTFSNVQANHTISATFAPVGVGPFVIAASAGPNGTITPSGSITVSQGVSQAFTITPNSGYIVASVTVDGSSAGAVTSYTFSNVQANHTISAAFQQQSTGTAWVGTFDGFPGAAWCAQWGVASPPQSDSGAPPGARSPDCWGFAAPYTPPNGGITISTDNGPSGHAAAITYYGAGSSAYSCSCGSAKGGAQFYAELQDTRTTANAGQNIGNNPGAGRPDLANARVLYLKYYVKFPVGFDFGKAGKLPGFFGGTEGDESGFNTGPNSFSTRYMWRGTNGEVYEYDPAMPSGAAGNDLGAGNWHWQADGQWHSIEQMVDITTGSLAVWYDGTQVYSATGIMKGFSATTPFGGIIFSTFYGGHDSSWGPKKNTTAEWADFTIDTKFIP